jgi:hypothetical protein
VWLAEESLLIPVWERVKHLLPQSLGGGALAGLNARWRLYRYDQGTGECLHPLCMSMRRTLRTSACMEADQVLAVILHAVVFIIC